MPQNFIDCGREQTFLMPPSLRDWLPEDHLAWFVIDAVAQMDLAAFCAAYRADGHGRAAYEPVSRRSSRGDNAFDVAMLGAFDHAAFDADWWGTYQWSGVAGPWTTCKLCS